MALFRDAVGEVRAVNHDRADTGKPPPTPVVRHSEHDDRSVMQSLLENLSEADFLKAAQTRRHLCIRVIHGKGRKNVEQAPRLKPAVNQWLQRNNKVLAFCSARMNDGGTGAVYVLLKREDE